MAMEPVLVGDAGKRGIMEYWIVELNNITYLHNMSILGNVEPAHSNNQ